MMNERANIKQAKPKVFPNNFEAEKALLCCLMIDGLVADDTIPLLNIEDFYNKRNKQIFEAMKSLHSQSASIDIVTLGDYLVKQGVEELAIMSYLAEINTILPSAANHSNYLQILKRDSLLRYLISSCNSIIERAYTSTNADEVMRYAEELIFRVSSEKTKSDLIHISEHTTQLMTRIDQMIKNKGALRGLMTGYPIFDNKTNGLQKGNLIILAARPSVGKTSFVLNVLVNIANQYRETPKKVALFALEMSSIELAQRIVSNLANVSMSNISSGRLKGDDNSKIWKATSELGKSMIYIDDSSLQTPDQILSKCRRLASKAQGLDLIMIDYLQLMYSDGKRDSARHEVISDISRRLKILAKEIDCPVIVLSQMSRNIDSRPNKEPRLSDLRESGSIEQDADIVMFLSREDEKAKNSPEYNIILDIAKHRNGELAKIRYIWQGQYIKFIESPDQDMSKANISTSNTET